MDIKKGTYSLILIFFMTSSAIGQVKLPRLISDGMVLQRGTEVKIWGWASPGERVSVEFIDQQYETQADNSGNWEIQLPELKPGGPFQMAIEGKNRLEIKDILIGDVWICSGQSNMELPMKRVRPLYKDEIAAADNPFIRYYEVPKTYDFKKERQDLEYGQWQKTTPESVLNFSATSYFFGKNLYEKYEVPIGLINSALGGSPAEAWLSEEALRAFPRHYQELQKFKDDELIQKIENEDRARANEWFRELGQKDLGYKDFSKNWRQPNINTADWATMEIPGYWADAGLGAINGVVWFRKKINIPFDPSGKTAKLNMGRIVDADSVFINSQFVGSTGYQYPPRWYDIPESLLKKGENTIVVRVISQGGNGGFVLDKPYELTIGEDTIDLKGEWKYKPGASMDRMKGQTFIRWKPGGLYKAMISPLLNYKMKGVIWYQGESNAGRPLEYRKLFPALINDWRGQWNQGDFPFLFVQLPNFMEEKDEPTDSYWALLREAQLQTLKLPNTGMAVAIDVGEWNDIHPLNKRDIGKRLALAAQKVAYGDQDVVHSGPLYQSMKVKGNKAILTFNNTGSGLAAKGGKLGGFAIAGKDKNFVWAEAGIKGDKVIVWHKDIKNPVAVRYAWADNPANANLYNKEGLPASPFRTDDFDLPANPALRSDH